MANRILRDYTDSEFVNKISYQAEVLFVRLMMKADDFGSFHANVKLVKSQCFPLRTDTVRDADISRWLDELQTSGLIVVYTHAGKQYLRIIEFGQRLRNMRNSFPKPSDDILLQAAAIRGKSPPETKRNESETESEIETETEGENSFSKKIDGKENFLIPEMMKVWKEFFPRYPEERKKDFTALREISQFIAAKESIDCDVGILPLFKQLTEYISTHDFYKNYSLLQVSRNIQSILISINNKENGKSNKRSTASSQQDAVNGLINEVDEFIKTNYS